MQSIQNGAQNQVIDILKNANKIAILGLSSDSSKPSFEVAKYLQEQGYRIIPISPKGGEILGERVFVSLQEAFNAESQIDILNVFRKNEALAQVAREVLTLANPPKCVWVQLGLKSSEAKGIIEGRKIPYVEDSCIKIEHKRLINDSNF